MFYKIVDNFLPKNEFKIIQNLLYSNSIPWYHSRYGVAHPEKLSKDGSYFTHIFYFFEKKELIVSNYYRYLKPIIDRLDISSILHAKGNLYPKTDKVFEHNTHTDFNFKHKGFLYYINTNNGFSKLNNGIEIKSVENRGLFFDSFLPHNSSSCSDSDSRININFNYF